MPASNSRPGNLPATLITIPLEIFDLVMSNLGNRTLLTFRLVCREFNQRVLGMDSVHRHFRYLSLVFERRSLRRALKLAPFPAFQRFAEWLRVNMTIEGSVLASPFEPGWERDGHGYFINPETIYDIRTLKSIPGKLPNFQSFHMLYHISKDKIGNDWAQVSLQKTLQSIFAICAAMEAHIKVVKMGGSYVDGHEITIDHTRLDRLWDKSTPLLDATCGNLQVLGIALEHDMAVSDLKWIKKFLLKCSMLEKLTIKNKSSSFTYTAVRDPPQHQFFDDIAATPGILPPVQALVLDSMDFTRQELTRFIGRFKDTIRSIDFYKVNMNGGEGGWLEFLEWLRENIPNLERFEFQGLTYNYSFVGQAVICFDSIFNNLDLHFKTLRGAQWQTYAKLPDGTLALNMHNELAFAEMGKFFSNLDKGKYILDSKPPEKKQVYTVAFEGSNSGAREALRLLIIAAAPQDPDGLLITSLTRIYVY